jgi:hypothetical protein
MRAPPASVRTAVAAASYQFAGATSPARAHLRATAGALSVRQARAYLRLLVAVARFQLGGRAPGPPA